MAFPFEVDRLQACEHADSIHHVEFDFYGRRLATVSSDKTICIWDRLASGKWAKSASWKKHGGAVWRVRFAHPDFGQVLATCSFDNTIHIYDRDAIDSSSASEYSARSGRGAASSITSSATAQPMASSDTANGWMRRAVLADSNASVTDIHFGPHYLGLKLAACTAAGRLLIYEAPDFMELDIWSLLHDIDVCPHRLGSLSWSTNRFSTATLLATASDSGLAPTSERLHFFKLTQNSNVINANWQKCSVRLLTESSDIHGNGGGKIGSSSSGNGGGLVEFAQPVSCLAFGPTLGLAYHKFAVGSGPQLYIYNLCAAGGIGLSWDESYGGGGDNLSTQGGALIHSHHSSGAELQTRLQAMLHDESVESAVVRLSWNVLGDTLAAVHTDGVTRIWKYIFASSKWMLASVVNPCLENDDGGGGVGGGGGGSKKVSVVGGASKEDVYY